MKLNQKNRVNTPFGDFQVDVESLVDQLFGDGRKGYSPAGCSTASWTPPISLSESETAYTLIVELPGVDPAEVNLEMQESRLQISGEKKIAEPNEGFESVREERRTGEFKRVFEFSKQVEPDGIQAKFKNGLLEVVLPKSAKVLPRKIDIKIAG